MNHLAVVLRKRRSSLCITLVFIFGARHLWSARRAKIEENLAGI
jgi:hypothetical protein